MMPAMSGQTYAPKETVNLKIDRDAFFKIRGDLRAGRPWKGMALSDDGQTIGLCVEGKTYWCTPYEDEME